VEAGVGGDVQRGVAADVDRSSAAVVRVIDRRHAARVAEGGLRRRAGGGGIAIFAIGARCLVGRGGARRHQGAQRVDGGWACRAEVDAVAG
jgi:hypothetical protein